MWRAIEAEAQVTRLLEKMNEEVVAREQLSEKLQEEQKQNAQQLKQIEELNIRLVLHC